MTLIINNFLMCSLGLVMAIQLNFNLNIFTIISCFTKDQIPSSFFTSVSLRLLVDIINYVFKI